MFILYIYIFIYMYIYIYIYIYADCRLFSDFVKDTRALRSARS